MEAAQQVMSPRALRHFRHDALRIQVITFSGLSKDWLKWSTRFTNQMEQVGCGSILDGTERRPEEGDATLYDAKNSFIFSHLANCCEGEAFAIIRSVNRKQGVDAWKALIKRYMSNARARKRELLSLILAKERKLKSGANVSKYIDEVLALKIELEEIGGNVDESTLIGVIEGAMPEEYRPLIVMMRRMPDGYDIDELVNSIKSQFDEGRLG